MPVDPLAGWAEAARDGDPVATSALVRATQSDVWRLCAAMVDAQEADDLAQETYLKALGSLRSYEGRAPFRLWLLGIARHTCTDHLRRRVRGRRLVVRLLSAPVETAPDASTSAGARDALAVGEHYRRHRDSARRCSVISCSRARATRERIVPTGTPQASAASS